MDGPIKPRIAKPRYRWNARHPDLPATPTLYDFVVRGWTVEKLIYHGLIKRVN